jgi:hypothetical protein
MRTWGPYSSTPLWLEIQSTLIATSVRKGGGERGKITPNNAITGQGRRRWPNLTLVERHKRKGK